MRSSYSTLRRFCYCCSTLGIMRRVELRCKAEAYIGTSADCWPRIFACSFFLRMSKAQFKPRFIGTPKKQSEVCPLAALYQLLRSSVTRTGFTAGEDLVTLKTTDILLSCMGEEYLAWESKRWEMVRMRSFPRNIKQKYTILNRKGGICTEVCCP